MINNIEVGKRYRTRQGQTITVNRIEGRVANFDFVFENGNVGNNSVWAKNEDPNLVGRNSRFKDPQDFMEELPPEFSHVQLSLFGD